MAYQIDFTSANYARRFRKKLFLRLLLLIGLAGAAWSAYYICDVYYNEYDLNKKLENYAILAKDVEKANAEWDKAEKEFNSLLHYYRLIWASNPTNFVQSVLDAEARNSAYMLVLHANYALDKLASINPDWTNNAVSVRASIDSLENAIKQSVIKDPEAATNSIDQLYESLKVAYAEFFEGLDPRIRELYVAHGGSLNDATNYVSSIISAFGPNYRPKSWLLTTGGECKLDYDFVFDSEDKAAQAGRIESNVSNVIVSLVTVVKDKVDVSGVKLENLLGDKKLDIAVKFNLPDAKSFPAKEPMLDKTTKEIIAMRKKVQETRLPEDTKFGTGTYTAKEIMSKYLPKTKDEDFPVIDDVINVAGWFNKADEFVKKHRFPMSPDSRPSLKERWNRIGAARLPWERFRDLDNEVLASATNRLLEVATASQKYKYFFALRKQDSEKKLRPLIEAYNRSDIFNKPMIEPDLKVRVAEAAGIPSVHVKFDDEPKVGPAILSVEDEVFTFTWVRWNMTLGAGSSRDAERDGASSSASRQNQFTLEKLYDCINRLLNLGPGYVLRSVSVRFNNDGNIAGAELEGLVPVKKVEEKKPEQPKGEDTKPDDKKQKVKPKGGR